MSDPTTDRVPVAGIGWFDRAEETGRRLSFTTATLALIALAGWITHTASGRDLSARAVSRLGFAPADTASLQIGRAIASAFVTNSAFAFWTALAAVISFVGVMEWRYGTLRSAFVFWGGHLVTLALSYAILAPLRLAGDAAGSLLFLTRDVGPSAGYVGCLGYLIAGLPRRARTWAFAVGAAALLGVLVYGFADLRSRPAEVSAALSHLLALAAGFSAGAVTMRRRSARQTA